MKRNLLLLTLPLLILLWGCRSGEISYEKTEPAVADSEGDIMRGENGGGEEGENTQEYAGRVTAGEWNDLNNWMFWSNLMTNSQADQEGTDYTGYSDYWGLYTNNRVKVKAVDADGNPLYDAQIRLETTDGNVIWTARTDNQGGADLWVGLTQQTNETNSSNWVLVLNNKIQNTDVKITHWGEEVQINELTDTEVDTSLPKQLDVAFIVDATGSMADEINFLKADLENIIAEVENHETTTKIRTAALFYRDEGDDYLTRVSDFSERLSATTQFISNQSADGGGDFPEAVHTALEVGLQKLAWNEDKGMRIAFMLLDAPPHKEDKVIASLQKSIPLYAAKGIRIIPVAASGVDKPTEFFLRFTAIATDGTYVFLTNDSGVGNEHIQATVGEYKVELLRDLMVRLIEQYM